MSVPSASNPKSREDVPAVRGTLRGIATLSRPRSAPDPPTHQAMPTTILNESLKAPKSFPVTPSKPFQEDGKGEEAHPKEGDATDNSH